MAMNKDSNGSRWSAALLLTVVLAACGGGTDDGAATTKADWEKKHGAAVAAVSTDLDQAREALSGGQRQIIISACTQLQEDLAEARKALPVPNPSVDGLLRSAFDAIEAGVPDCLDGARIANQAHITETAIAEFRDARPKMDEANKAIAEWT